MIPRLISYYFYVQVFNRVFVIYYLLNQTRGRSISHWEHWNIMIWLNNKPIQLTLVNFLNNLVNFFRITRERNLFTMQFQSRLKQRQIEWNNFDFINGGKNGSGNGFYSFSIQHNIRDTDTEDKWSWQFLLTEASALW